MSLLHTARGVPATPHDAQCSRPDAGYRPTAATLCCVQEALRRAIEQDPSLLAQHPELQSVADRAEAEQIKAKVGGWMGRPACAMPVRRVNRCTRHVHSCCTVRGQLPRIVQQEPDRSWPAHAACAVSHCPASLCLPPLVPQGNAAFSAGKLDEAVKLFTRCIELDASNHIYYSNRAAAHTGLKDYKAAVRDAR